MEFLFTNGATTLIEVVKVLEREKAALENAMLLIDNKLVRKLKANMNAKPCIVKGVEELIFKDEDKIIAIFDLEYSASKCRKVYRIVVDGKVLFFENKDFPIKTVILE